MNESTLGVEQIELAVKSRPGRADRGGVAEHAQGTGHLGHVAAGTAMNRQLLSMDQSEARREVLTPGKEARCRYRA